MSNSEEKGKLFVGGLSWETTQASLLAYFSRFGEVTDCVVVMNAATGKSRGFGFVTFKDPSCVETVQAAGPHILDGKQIDPNGCNRKRTSKGIKGTETSRRKLFVGGLPANIDEAQLREGFSKYGKVNDVVIVYDQQKQRPRGFGFLTFDAEESVDRVVRERYVQINGKQVECKRAEPREAPALVTEPTGMMMLAQGPDGMVSLVPAQPAAGSAFICSPGAGIVNPADLASAYRTIGSEMMQSSVQAGLRLMVPGLPNSQYMMLAPGSGTGVGNTYLFPGASSGSAMAMLPGASAGQHSGLVLPGGASGAVMLPGGTNASYLVPSSTGVGNFILPGSNSGSGMLVAGSNGTGAQYLMTYPSGAFVQPHVSGVGADLSAAYAYGSSVSPFGVQLQQGMYTYAKTEPSSAVTTPAAGAADTVLSDKTSPAAVAAAAAAAAAAASYPLINPYAAMGLVGGAGESQEDGSLRSAVLAPVSGESQASMTPATGQLAVTPRMGYYFLPGYQAQLPGLSSSVLAGVPNDPSVQAALLAATPTQLACSRLATPGLLNHQGYHPYRR